MNTDKADKTKGKKTAFHGLRDGCGAVTETLRRRHRERGETACHRASVCDISFTRVSKLNGGGVHPRIQHGMVPGRGV